jgi:hypothetical protein
MSQPVIRVKGGKAWYCHGLTFQKCVCRRADGFIVAGKDWLEEIVQTGIAEKIMVVTEPQFDAYRTDADEDWLPSPNPNP